MSRTIYQCIEQGDEEGLRRLLLMGIDYKHEDHSPLVHAVRLGHIELVRLLLIAGSDPNARHGATLMSAIKKNDYECAIMLITAGARTDEARIYASKHGDKRFAEWLNNQASLFPPPSTDRLCARLGIVS